MGAAKDLLLLGYGAIGVLAGILGGIVRKPKWRAGLPICAVLLPMLFFDLREWFVGSPPFWERLLVLTVVWSAVFYICDGVQGLVDRARSRFRSEPTDSAPGASIPLDRERT